MGALVGAAAGFGVGYVAYPPIVQPASGTKLIDLTGLSRMSSLMIGALVGAGAGYFV